MPTIPNSEPDVITAGETLQWTRSLPDYPASTYTLKYALQSGSTLIAITASGSGSTYSITVAAATTADYTPGVYLWVAYAESIVPGTRTILARGAVTILPSPLAALGTTHATRTLALIEAAIEGRIPNGLETTNIDGQELQRIPVANLLRLRSYYRQLVTGEQQAALQAAGLGNRRNSYARFTAVR